MRPMKMSGAVCLIGSAMLFAACQPAPQADAAANSQKSVKLQATQPSQKQAPAKAVQVKKAVANATPAKVSQDAVPASASVASSQEIQIVTTVTGCLERDGDSFQLKDTSGEIAPKSRSWKSGFIKKGSATIELIDATNRLPLTNHVGYRVSVTGGLVDREMHARSVRATSDRCD
jgi:hypothetical protein